MENQKARDDAGEALRRADDAKQAAVRRSSAPVWYFPSLGVVMAGVSVAFSLGPSLVRIGAALLAVIVGRLLFGTYMDRRGLAVGGLRSGKSTLWSVLWIVVVMALIAGTWLLDIRMHAGVVVGLGAALVFLVTLAYGFLFESSRRSQVEIVSR